MSNIITLERVYSVAKADCILNPMKQSNGHNFPFVKRVRRVSDLQTEMILSEKELNNPSSNFFIAEDHEITINHGTTFDLDDEYQRNLWECIKNSPLIAPERDSKDKNGDLLIDGGPKRYGIAEFYVSMPGRESSIRINKMRIVADAYQHIKSDTNNGRKTKVKLLGKSMYNAPDTDIEDYLYNRADKNPKEIIDLYVGADTSLKLMLIDARDQKIIKYDNGLFTYGDHKLGMTEASVISFLKEARNKQIYISIRDESYPELVPIQNENKINSNNKDKNLDELN